MNAHPDSTFSSHLHNEWTLVQLAKANKGKKYIDNEYFLAEDKRMTNSEQPGDFVQLNQIDDDPDLYYEG